eukprot:359937-Chlamydomonas_euryale.AAC.31
MDGSKEAAAGRWLMCHTHSCVVALHNDAVAARGPQKAALFEGPPRAILHYGGCAVLRGRRWARRRRWLVWRPVAVRDGWRDRRLKDDAAVVHDQMAAGNHLHLHTNRCKQFQALVGALTRMRYRQSRTLTCLHGPAGVHMLVWTSRYVYARVGQPAVFTCMRVWGQAVFTCMRVWGQAVFTRML